MSKSKFQFDAWGGMDTKTVYRAVVVLLDKAPPQGFRLVESVPSSRKGSGWQYQTRCCTRFHQRQQFQLPHQFVYVAPQAS